MDDVTAKQVRALWAVAQRCGRRTHELTHPTDSTDPATWHTAKKNEVVKALEFEAQQLLTVVDTLRQLLPAPYPTTPETMAFWRSMGLSIAEIARRADVCVQTVRNHLKEHDRKVGVKVERMAKEGKLKAEPIFRPRKTAASEK